MKPKIEKKCIFFIICIYILIFQNFIQNYIKIIQYFDEILAVIAIPVLIYKAYKNDLKMKKYDFIILVNLVAFFCISFFSSFKYNYQPAIIVFSDALVVSKFFLVYSMSNILFDVQFIENNKRLISKHFRIISVFLFILTILNYIFKIWPYDDYRFGIMSNKLYYMHPTYLAAVCVFLIAALVLFQDKDSYRYIILIASVLVSTLRFKAIGSCLVILFLIFYVLKNHDKISFFKLGILAIILIMLAWEQISFYYIQLDKSARKVLTNTSLKIAIDYFPLGTGFATFGSYFSSVSYSPIYYKYGINGIKGLQNGKTAFISDTFWPMIIGQFGFLGTLLYVSTIIVILKKIQIEYSVENKNLYLAKLISLVYLLISSTSESAFVNPIAIPLAIIIGINMSNNQRKTDIV